MNDPRNSEAPVTITMPAKHWRMIAAAVREEASRRGGFTSERLQWIERELSGEVERQARAAGPQKGSR